MSIDQAKAFLKELARNQELQQKLSDSATAEERMQLAKDAGFEFSAEEFNNAHSELFDEDIDSVSGGGWTCGTTCGTECGGKFSQTVCG
ncbi:MAG: Nif11-like leader peptide family natural product precursor [Chlorobiales bacterium]|nr:Nif11-like leader peptide family natural product precursor [Chlorobiales bacterium]